MENFSALILSGGNSERMHFPKPYLKFGTSTFIEKIIDTYKSFGTNKIVVVLNKAFCEGYWETLYLQIKQNAHFVMNDKQIGRAHV